MCSIIRGQLLLLLDSSNITLLPSLRDLSKNAVIIHFGPFYDAPVSLFLCRNGSSSLDTLPSVWSWDIQYNSDYISLFKNPLYEFNAIQSTTTSLPRHLSNTTTQRKIIPNCHLSQVVYIALDGNVREYPTMHLFRNSQAHADNDSI